MLKSVKVRDYMKGHLLTFRVETDLFRAIDLLLEHRVSGAPVVDEDKRLIGVLSENDCLRGILSGAYYEDAGGVVGNYMTQGADVVSPDDDIIDVAERFISARRRRFPVVEDGKVVGQISRRDVLCAVKQFAQHDDRQAPDTDEDQ